MCPRLLFLTAKLGRRTHHLIWERQINMPWMRTCWLSINDYFAQFSSGNRIWGGRVALWPRFWSSCRSGLIPYTLRRQRGTPSRLLLPTQSFASVIKPASASTVPRNWWFTEEKMKAILTCKRQTSLAIVRVASLKLSPVLKGANVFLQSLDNG